MEEDIAFGPLNIGKTRSQTKEIVTSVCENLKILHLKERITFNLSGGEKRLVALASVMAMNPEMYLFDEPTMDLDEESRECFLKILRSKLKSYVVISHDKEFLRDSTDTIYTLKNGQIYDLF